MLSNIPLPEGMQPDFSLATRAHTTVSSCKIFQLSCRPRKFQRTEDLLFSWAQFCNQCICSLDCFLRAYYVSRLQKIQWSHLQLGNDSDGCRLECTVGKAAGRRHEEPADGDGAISSADCLFNYITIERDEHCSIMQDEARDIKQEHFYSQSEKKGEIENRIKPPFYRFPLEIHYCVFLLHSLVMVRTQTFTHSHFGFPLSTMTSQNNRIYELWLPVQCRRPKSYKFMNFKTGTCLTD